MTTTPRFLSYDDAHGTPCYGLAKADGIVNLSRHFGAQYPDLRSVVAAGALGQLADHAELLRPDTSFDTIHFAIPIRNPEKIICVGVNYPERNAEYRDGLAAPDKPSLFVRFPRSFVGHGEPLVCPSVSPQFDYEGEIVLIIGKQGRAIPKDKAFDHIAALTLCNEGSVRDWIRHGKFNVTQGKNFDASGSMGPWLIPFTDKSQLNDINLQTRINGELRQSDRTANMIFGFAELISYISTFTTLVPGDVIVTGTPTGAGARHDPPRWLKPGDLVEVRADGLGTLRNEVMAEEIVTEAISC